MIELIFSDRCSGCSQCISVCPTNVLALGSDGKPRIANQGACQTCFMCEAYCPTDALYVSPVSVPVGVGSPHASEEAVRSSGLLGGYREMVGWGRGRTPGSRLDQNPVLTSIPPLAEPRLGTPAPLADGPWNHQGHA